MKRIFYVIQNMKGKRLPSNYHLQYTGIPYVIIKPTKQYRISRPNSVAKINNQFESHLSLPSKESKSSLSIQRYTQNVKNRLPFLNKTSIDLNEEEIMTLNESLNKGPQTNLSLNSPSRLQQIRLSRFDIEQKNLALDIDTSEPYIVSTASESIPLDLERDGSLISINCEEDVSNQIHMRSSLTSAAPTSADLSEMSRAASMSSRHEPVSIKEVQNQVWLYCHSHEAQKEKKKINLHPFDATIENDNKKVILNAAPGRKRLINAIRNVADASQADKCKKVPEKKIDKPIENTFAAHSFSLFLQEKNIDAPFYLSPIEKLP